MRTLFGTFKIGCWLYAALSVIIALIVLALVAKHAPEMNTTTTPTPFPW